MERNGDLMTTASGMYPGQGAKIGYKSHILLETDPAIRAIKIQRKEPDVPLVGAGKARKLVDRRIKKEDEDNTEVEPWWPPFEFN